MDYTSKLNLQLPDFETDLADIRVINNNMEILDNVVGNLNLGIGNIETLTTEEKSSIVGAINEIDDAHKSYKAESSYWKRVDTLSAPIAITSTEYDNPTVVPLSEPYGTDSIDKGIIYAVDLAGSADFRNSQIVFFSQGISSSAGRLMIAGVSATRNVGRIVVPGNANAIGFYDATGTMYIRAVYKVKEVEF